MKKKQKNSIPFRWNRSNGIICNFDSKMWYIFCFSNTCGVWLDATQKNDPSGRVAKNRLIFFVETPTPTHSYTGYHKNSVMETNDWRMEKTVQFFLNFVYKVTLKFMFFSNKSKSFMIWFLSNFECFSKKIHKLRNKDEYMNYCIFFFAVQNKSHSLVGCELMGLQLLKCLHIHIYLNRYASIYSVEFV